MTALEEQVRAGLRQVNTLPVRWPHPGAWKWCAPDVTVFGPQQDVREPVDPWPVTRTCGTHAVEWGDYGRRCWCCEAGVPGVKTS